MREIGRKNVNRGYTKLRVWNDSIALYKLAVNMFKNVPYKMTKTVSNFLDSIHSISRNIAEGYCRRSIKEYLNFLNIALGSCGESYSSIFAFSEVNFISKKDFDTFDELHYKVENELLALIKSIQNKKKKGNWDEEFI